MQLVTRTNKLGQLHLASVINLHEYEINGANGELIRKIYLSQIMDKQLKKYLIESNVTMIASLYIFTTGCT